MNDNFGTIGYLIITIIIVSWIVSIVIYRVRGHDRLDLHPAP